MVISGSAGWRAGLSFIGLWVVQTLVVYFAPLVFLMVLALGLDERDATIWATFNYCAFAAIGFALGTLVSRLFPALERSGRWVWIGPAGVLVCCVLWAMSLGDFDVLTLLFGTGEAGWVNGFITLPALGCCCYSVALLWRHEKTKLLPSTQRNDD
jgi:hypothetical protein